MFLGIDGGGTGCRAAVADASGQVLATASAGPANIASDPAGARANILTAAEDALAQVVGDAGVQDGLRNLVAGLGLAGANAAGAAGRLALNLPFARLRIETDVIAAVKGALGPADGIVAAMGTGSVFARQQAGIIRHVGGWGLVLGDEGGGAWIGREILSCALRAVDGLMPQTPLLSDLTARLGGPAGVVGFSLVARPAAFAELAPEVIGSSDPAARSVMAQAQAGVDRTIRHLQDGARLPVVFIGGLGSCYARALGGRWPLMQARGTALDGALILAREAV